MDGRLEVGAVYDPTRDELFTAERGQGAFLNGTRLQVSQTETLIDALLVTGFPYAVQEKMTELVGLFAAFLGESRAVRRLGSAALDICYVACGRMDGFWEQGLNAWDIAAGVLLVEEAGGRVTASTVVPSILRTRPHRRHQRADPRRDAARREPEFYDVVRRLIGRLACRLLFDGRSGA